VKTFLVQIPMLLLFFTLNTNADCLLDINYGEENETYTLESVFSAWELAKPGDVSFEEYVERVDALPGWQKRIIADHLLQYYWEETASLTFEELLALPDSNGRDLTIEKLTFKEKPNLEFYLLEHGAGDNGMYTVQQLYRSPSGQTFNRMVALMPDGDTSYCHMDFRL